MPLLHLVCFKYKPGVDEATRADHLARLQGLRGLAGVTDLKAGADVVRSPRSYDTGLAVTFPDRAALDAYQTDPAHVPVAQYGAGLSEHIVAVDFEI
jgi:Stress responsive A/B Barrel Domain